LGGSGAGPMVAPRAPPFSEIKGNPDMPNSRSVHEFYLSCLSLLILSSVVMQKNRAIQRDES